jgi:hypothetical protein
MTRLRRFTAEEKMALERWTETCRMENLPAAAPGVPAVSKPKGPPRKAAKSPAKKS